MGGVNIEPSWIEFSEEAKLTIKLANQLEPGSDLAYMEYMDDLDDFVDIGLTFIVDDSGLFATALINEIGSFTREISYKGGATPASPASTNVSGNPRNCHRGTLEKNRECKVEDAPVSANELEAVTARSLSARKSS